MNTEIVLYSTGCRRCQQLKQMLDKNSVEYTVVSDIEALMNKGISKVPVMEVNGKRYDYEDAMEIVVLGKWSVA